MANNNCHSIPSSLPNTTYCGITSGWEPRFSSDTVLVTMFVIPLMCAITILCVSLPYLRTHLWREYNDEHHDKEIRIDLETLPEPSQDGHVWYNPGTIRSICFYIKKRTFYTSIVVPIVIHVWDTADVAFDLALFYQLEKGQLLDSSINFNQYASNAIYAFAVLGVAKMVLCVFVLFCATTVEYGKHINLIIVYLFEDAGEMFVEYFFVEKYIVGQPTPLYFVRDVVLFVVSVSTIIGVIVWARGVRWTSKHKITFIICCVAIGLINLLRVLGVGYQYTTSKLHRNCLDVVDGRLVQTPFARGCLREIDYVILGTVFIPIMGMVVLII